MDAKAVKEWQESNPLRQWRLRTRLIRSLISASIGVSQTTLQKWEDGNSEPNRDNMKALADLTGNPLIAGAWQDWQSRRPYPQATALQDVANESPELQRA